jgi:ATP-binding cassette subfamily D (ALD) long-chain fatty acid import protein
MVHSLYNYQLSRNVGAEGLVLLTVLVQTSAEICKFPSWRNYAERQ